MAVTDLTGYTWVGKTDISGLSYRTYSINFTSNNRYFNMIEYDAFVDDTNSVRIYEINNPSIFVYNDNGHLIEPSLNEWLFTGGTDATNADLISWLETNGTLQTPSTPRKSVDLTTLAGWEALSSGSHNITIVAKADGYRDSAPSAAVQVEKSAGFVQVFPSKTSDNHTLFGNLNQSKIYSILLSGWSGGVGYLKYENGSWNSNLIYIVSQTSNSVKAIATGGGAFAEYLYGITLEGDTEATTADFEGLSGTAVYARYECFVEGTNITLADGSIKPVQDIRYGDEVLCYDFTNGVQTVSYIDWMIPERIAMTYWEITLSDGTVLNLVGPKAHRLYNITKQRFDYPQDFEPNDLTLKEDGTTAHVVSCREIEKTVRFYNIASHEHINVYANGVLTSNRLNNRYKIVDNKFTDEKVMTDKEVSDYRAYLETIKA